MTHKLYVIAYSYDWQEGHSVHRTLEGALAQVRQDFDIDEVTPTVVNNSKEFWESVTKAYEEGSWKSYQLFSISDDLSTISVKAIY